MENFNCDKLFKNMPVGLAYNKVVYDENKEPKDFIVLKTNKKFEAVTGLKKEDVINHKGTKILENFMENPKELVQLCGQVALTGRSNSFEAYSKLTNKWFDVKVFSQNKHYFSVAFNDITERKNKEKELKEKSERLNNIFNNSNDIIYSVSWADLKIKFISKAVKEIFGYRVEEFKEDPMLIFNITHPDDEHIQEETFKKLKEKGYVEREFRVICKDGSIKWVQDRGEMVYNENNDPIRVEGVMRDITERKITENKLKYNKEMYETIFNSAPIGIILENSNGEIIKVNNSECEMTGYTKDELEGSNVKGKFVLSEYRELAERNFDKLLKGEDVQFDIKIPKKNGEMIYEHLKETSITLPDGSTGIISMHMDITGRKKKEEKIQEQRKRMENTIKATEAGTFEWNVQTGETIFNEKWAEMIGYTLDEISPTSFDTWKKFTHPADLRKSKKLLAKHFRGETEQYKVEIRMKHKKGHWIWVLSQGKVISRTEEGQPLKMFGIHLDITQRKKRLKELKVQHNFQKLLADISSDLVGVNNSNFDQQINKSLKEIGQFFEIERSYIFQLSADEKYINNIHEWTAEGIKSEKENLQNLSVERLPWLMDKLYNKETVNVFNVEQLEESAQKEKELFIEQNIKSLVIMPIFIKDELWGFFGFDSVKEKTNFNQIQLDKIKIITDVITSAFLQHFNIKRIEKLTYKDSLTELYNRRYFEEEMVRLDTKRQLPISIIMVDINGLKMINDSYGHKKGDQMLIETGKILKEELREEDILARHGGDEFTILLPQTSYEETERIITRLRNKNNEINEFGITISFSLGFATKTKVEEDIKDVLKKADDDMYRNKLSESRSNKNKIVQNLLNTLDAKSSETKEHAMRMTRLARDLGEKMDLSNSELNNLTLIATLHDIGKTTISEDILTKSGKLTNKEWEIVKGHPIKGYKIASASEEFAVVAKEILCHHEHWNGNGYPDGLQGKEIPYLARIISIIDAYDVMTNERPYSESISKKEAIYEIKKCAGEQFDPELAHEFIELQENRSN